MTPELNCCFYQLFAGKSKTGRRILRYSPTNRYTLAPSGLGINVQAKIHLRDELSGDGNVPWMYSANATVA